MARPQVEFILAHGLPEACNRCGKSIEVSENLDIRALNTDTRSLERTRNRTNFFVGSLYFCLYVFDENI